jgi:hypothetical protein
MLSVCLYNRLVNFCVPESVYMKLCIYIMATEPTSIVYFINPSHQNMCLYVYPPIIARQRIGKKLHTQQ